MKVPRLLLRPASLSPHHLVLPLAPQRTLSSSARRPTASRVSDAEIFALAQQHQHSLSLADLVKSASLSPGCPPRPRLRN